MSKAKSTQTYRPVFTQSQITHLIKVLQSSPSAESTDCLQKLLPYQIKIQMGLINPVYTTKEGGADLASDLGFVSLPAPKPVYPIESLLTTPDMQLTPAQLEQKLAYKWENGLMTAQEEAEFFKMKGL